MSTRPAGSTWTAPAPTTTEMADTEMGRRLREHPDLIARLRGGDISALDDLLEAVMDVKVVRSRD